MSARLVCIDRLSKYLTARGYHVYTAEGAVILMTGSQDESLLKEALKLGSLDIIGKPFELERIGLAVDVSLILAAR